ncbi:MAG TPA: hypothetical protein VE959_05705 [Bryobacteraceae bacterium]|nr:hypothetical protein [Bryobacteraceae bacterium]
MRLTKYGRIGITLIALCAAAPAVADSNFRVRRTTRDDIPPGKGQCDIRLQVDNEVEVAVHGDFVSIRTISGRDAYDDGSECNAPLPDREVQGFNFQVVDSRGEIRLLSEPDRRNGFSAIVHIRDTPSGVGRYHFRLSWVMTGAGDIRRDMDRPPDIRRDNDRPPDFGRPGGGFAWNNVLHYSNPGRGASNLSGVGSQRLFDATVDIDRGGHVQVSFRTDSGRPLMFTGSVVGRDGDALKADVVADDRMLRLRGSMFISMDQRENIYRISLEATNGRDRLQVNWDRNR